MHDCFIPKPKLRDTPMEFDWHSAPRFVMPSFPICRVITPAYVDDKPSNPIVSKIYNMALRYYKNRKFSKHARFNKLLATDWDKAVRMLKYNVRMDKRKGRR